MAKIFDHVFSWFRWYRKKKGGTWYFISLEEYAGGIEGPISMWVTNLQDYEGASVLETETWPSVV